MDRKKITAWLIGCEPGEFMAYADQEEKGTVVVGPDGKKFRFDMEKLKKAEEAMKMATIKEITKRQAERSPAKPKPAAKPKTTTKRQAATKSKPKTKKPTVH